MPRRGVAQDRLADIAPETRGIAAGIAGLAAWEAVARLAAPLWLGHPLEPTALIAAATGFENPTLLMILHLATGIAVMPGLYLLVALPAARVLSPAPPWPVVGVAFGILIWLLAMVVVAHMIAGLPLFLAWQPIVFVSLAGHVAMGLGIGGYLAWSRRGQRDRM